MYIATRILASWMGFLFFSWMVECYPNLVISYICLWSLYTCAKFQPDQGIFSSFCVCAKRRKKPNWNFAHSYLRNGWHNLLQIWNVAFCYRRTLPPQIWCSSDKRSQIYECMKIYTLLFSTPVCTHPMQGSWAACSFQKLHLL